jgi:hypothetical protein
MALMLGHEWQHIYIYIYIYKRSSSSHLHVTLYLAGQMIPQLAHLLLTQIVAAVPSV